MTPDQIMWAMTVPAEWSEASKQSMRKAALEAGITTSLDSDALVLLYEPEAAALYAKSQEEIQLTEGTTFIIIDVGGGTTDMTMHNVQKHGDRLVLGEASHRSGLLVGGKLLDQVNWVITFKRSGQFILSDTQSFGSKQFCKHSPHVRRSLLCKIVR